MRRGRLLLWAGLLLWLAACTQPLKLEVTAPANNAVIPTPQTTVEGSVNRSATVSYQLNDGGAQTVDVSNNRFSFGVTLAPGANSLVVNAAAGQQTDSQTLNLTYAVSISESGALSSGTLSDSNAEFIRPDTSSDKLTSGLPEAARTVFYDVTPFIVSTQGFYAILSEQQFDGFIYLYQNSFDPNNPTANLINYNDDAGGRFFDPDEDPPGISQVTSELRPDTTYFLVTTAYAGQSEEDFAVGEFTNTITAGVNPPPDAFSLPAVDNNAFNITVRFAGGLTPDQQAVFTDAAARWSQIITENIENIENFVLPPEFFFPGTGPINGTLDDLLIDVIAFPRDGPGGVLASAGPVLLRSGSSSNPLIPAYGIMLVDSDDFLEGGFFADPQAFEDTIVHEMGHVLGIGTTWVPTGNTEGVLGNPPTVPPGLPNPDYDPRFTGAGAVAEYQALLAAAGKVTEASVPIANTGGPGNFNGHWREISFENELMTPYFGGEEQLSRLTAASLGDIGYTVDVESAAVDQDYSLPLPATFVQTAPADVSYEEFVDFLKAGGSSGSASAAVEAVNLKLDLEADPDDESSAHPINAVSGCDEADFAGFTAGSIALVQRGACFFSTKVENAINAGAVGVIIMNQGNGEARAGLLSPLIDPVEVPVIGIGTELGRTLAETAGLEVSMSVNVASLPELRITEHEVVLLPIGTVSSKGQIQFFPGESPSSMLEQFERGASLITQRNQPLYR